jgi:nucleoside-diphosphate-sugar epimerase
VNFDAIGQMLALAKSGGVKRFISASSSSVFGARTESDINESLEPEPLTYYSKYKMLSEWLVVAANNPDFVTVSIRPATICGYSPRQRFDLTVNKLTADAITKRVITVHGGEQRRPNLGITDMIRCYEELLNTPAAKIAGRTFNCGFENLKVMEIAQLIQKQLADLDVRIDRTETKDNRDYHISSKKITAELGFSPKGTIATEVQDLRKALESGAFPNTDAEKHYNMKSMQMKRDPSSYAFLSK